MPYIPQSVPSDSQILLGFLSIALFLFVMWMFFNWMERYAEKKEKELEREVEEIDETGNLY